MYKIILGAVFSMIFCAAISATAQSTDTVKKDTIKIDTTVLNKYRIDPQKNALPLRTRAVQIQPELIPLSMLDYKVNYWHKWITLAVNLNQSAFSNNYSAGGVNAVALGTNFDYKTEYNKAPFDYVGELNLIYGISKNKGQGARKTNDRIYFDNKIATQLSKHWLFFGSLNFTSQFDKGYNYLDPAPPQLISQFMAPGYLTESTGLEYKPSNHFDLRLGAATARQTFVLNKDISNLPDNYGVLPGHEFINQMAFQSVASLDKDLMKNLHLNFRYTLFIPYQQSLAYISHRIDAILTAKVNSLIVVTMNGTFLYDKNTSAQPQGTEGLALGVAYNFP